LTLSRPFSLLTRGKGAGGGFEYLLVIEELIDKAMNDIKGG